MAKKKLTKVYIPRTSAKYGYEDEGLSSAFGKPISFKYSEAFLKQAYSDNIEFVEKKKQKRSGRLTKKDIDMIKDYRLGDMGYIDSFEQFLDDEGLEIRDWNYFTKSEKVRTVKALKKSLRE